MVIRRIMKAAAAHRRAALSTATATFGVAVVSFAVVTGCRTSQAAPSREAPPEPAAIAASQRAETESYTVEMLAGGTARAGAESSVTVKVTAKGSYHINQQYPYKFKADEAAAKGVRYPKPILLRADGKFDEKTATFVVPFVPAAAGKVTVAGVLSMSVCNDATCVMDRPALEREVDVK